MDNVLTVCISNREQYENGIPGGEWLNLPTTAEQLQAALQAVNATLDSFFVYDFDSSIQVVTRLTHDEIRLASIDELNYLAAKLESLNPVQIEKLNINGDILGYWNNVHHLTEYVQNIEYFMYIPGVTDYAGLGDYYLNKSGLVQMPDGWKVAVDVERLGQLAAEQEKGILWDNGYILETGDEWQPVTEIPQEYRIMNFPQPEQDAPYIDYDTISTHTPAVTTTQPPEIAAEPQPVIPIVLSSEKPADKLKEITDKLEQGIAGIFESEQYKSYLKTLSKFHNYSLNNTILIAMQKPDASLVAGFNTWKNQFKRNVMKGQKGIKIIAPSPFKVKEQREKLDPQTQRPVIGRDGKPVTEEVEIKIPAYKVVSVFDVSQTEGKELPTIGVDVLTGNVEQYKDFFIALEKASPVPVAFEPIKGGANGYYHLEDKRIAINEGMSELQTLKTAIHEIAHARLHDVDLNAPADEQNRVDRRTREIEAESIAYTVCQHYGLDTSDYSFGYVAGWSSNRELTELKASLETIRATAAELITEIDGHFAELQQEKEMTAEQEQATSEQPDIYCIYQLKQDGDTRDYRFEPLDRLQAAGLTVAAANYELVYSAPITSDTDSLEKILEKYNIDHSEDFTGHSLSVSDVVTLNRDGKETAHYVDSFGYTEVPEFLQPNPAFDMQQTTDRLQKIHDNVQQADPNKTMGEAAYRMAIKRLDKLSGEIPETQTSLKMLIEHAAGSTDLSMLQERMASIMQQINSLATAEMSEEQNYNMIDGIPNNRPTVDELEKLVKAGQTISLVDLANALKADKAAERSTGAKPSIREQLKAGKEQCQKEKSTPDNTRDKSPDLEV